MGKQYHYEYRLRCVDLRNGGATRGPYKTLSWAESEKRYVENMSGGHWMIEKFRVYND